MSKSLENRLCLITGASRGIGAAIARRFATEGAHVILVARTVGGLEEVDDQIQAIGGTATLIPMDLTKQDQFDKLAAGLATRFGRLDVVVGNAADLGTLSPVAHSDYKMWERVFRLNVLSYQHLIRACDPLLHQSAAASMILVTSNAAKSQRAFWGPYAASKAALETMAHCYAEEVGNQGIRVNLVDPGATRTAMRAAAFPGEDPMRLKPPEAVTDIFVALASADDKRHNQRLMVDG
jgi:NAD(P)-dependent dehydrogenase (short-subunit alcohol dehydrogenase family)